MFSPFLSNRTDSVEVAGQAKREIFISGGRADLDGEPVSHQVVRYLPTYQPWLDLLIKTIRSLISMLPNCLDNHQIHSTPKRIFSQISNRSAALYLIFPHVPEVDNLLPITGPMIPARRSCSAGPRPRGGRIDGEWPSDTFGGKFSYVR
jgi:hypothetical protein